MNEERNKTDLTVQVETQTDSTGPLSGPQPGAWSTVSASAHRSGPDGCLHRAARGWTCSPARHAHSAAIPALLPHCRPRESRPQSRQN